METNGRQRDIAVDIIKGLGIFCMVAGHSGSPITKFVYLFHMAIFFIASGYCYKETSSDELSNVVSFVKRKVLTLWLPFVIWNSLFSILHNFFIRINVYTNNPLLLEYVDGKYIQTTEYWSIADVCKNVIKTLFFQGSTQLGGAFWFLGTLMEISIAYCVVDFILRKVLKQNIKMLLLAQLVVSVLLLVMGFLCSIYGYTFLGLNRVFSFYILFYGGYLIKKYRISGRERSKVTHGIVLCATFAILLICNQFGAISLGNNRYENPMYLLLTSFAGWQFLYEVAYFTEKLKRLSAAVVCMGQNTLAVVLLHFLCFKLVSLVGVLVYGQPICLIAAFPILYEDGLWWIFYTVVGLCVPILLSVFYKDIKNKMMVKTKN